MSDAARDLIDLREGDVEGFITAVHLLAKGVARVYQPARLYVLRVDHWFGPRWFHFSGKVLGELGVHKRELTVPPFVPHRIVEQRVFAGPRCVEEVVNDPLHIQCASSFALKRRLVDVDRSAAFLWFGGEMVDGGRGCVMVYLPCCDEDAGFYVGFSQHDQGWRATKLMEITPGELDSLMGLHVAPTMKRAAEPELIGGIGGER
jgi:hypothetical protein